MRSELRYELVLEPFELWTVWDNVIDAPAEFGPNVLIGMPEEEAGAACDMLNDLHRRRSAQAVEDAA